MTANWPPNDPQVPGETALPGDLSRSAQLECALDPGRSAGRDPPARSVPLTTELSPVARCKMAQWESLESLFCPAQSN